MEKHMRVWHPLKAFSNIINAFLILNINDILLLLLLFSHIREDLTNVNMAQLKNSDIDSEHSSPDKINRTIVSPTNKSTKLFENLHFIISYSKYKRIPMSNDSDQGTDSGLNQRKFKTKIIHLLYNVFLIILLNT